jgi:hypothetical protein
MFIDNTGAYRPYTVISVAEPNLFISAPSPAPFSFILGKNTDLIQLLDPIQYEL